LHRKPAAIGLLAGCIVAPVRAPHVRPCDWLPPAMARHAAGGVSPSPIGALLHAVRFNREQVARRMTYTFDVDRRVITLTTFRKQRDNESREVRRARAVLKRHRASDEKRR
jgi:hypothetical protein